MNFLAANPKNLSDRYRTPTSLVIGPSSIFINRNVGALTDLTNGTGWIVAPMFSFTKPKSDDPDAVSTTVFNSKPFFLQQFSTNSLLKKPFGYITIGIGPGLIKSMSVLIAMVIGWALFAVFDLVDVLSTPMPLFEIPVLFPFIGQFIATMPASLGYAIMLVIFAQLIGIGLRSDKSLRLDQRDILVIGLSILCGSGIFGIPASAFSGTPPIFTYVLDDGLIVGMLAVLILEHIIFRQNKKAELL